MSRFPSHPLPPPLKPIDQYDQSPEFAKKLDHSYHVILEGLPEVAIESHRKPNACSNCDRHLLDQVLASYAFDGHIVHTYRMVVYSSYRHRPMKIILASTHGVAMIVKSFQLFPRYVLPWWAKKVVFRSSEPDRYKPFVIEFKC